MNKNPLLLNIHKNLSQFSAHFIFLAQGTSYTEVNPCFSRTNQKKESETQEKRGQKKLEKDLKIMSRFELLNLSASLSME
jgi:hypothetical protein